MPESDSRQAPAPASAAEPAPAPSDAGVATTAAPDAAASDGVANGSAEQLVWTFNPWRRWDKPLWRRPYLALLLELAIAAIAGYTFTQPHWWPTSLAWGGLSLLFMLAYTAPLYLPVRYRLDERGVTVYFAGVPSFRSWAHYRNYYVHRTGVHLTTMPTPSALDPFRGHFLQFNQQAGGTTNREPVAAFLAEHITRPEPPATG